MYCSLKVFYDYLVEPTLLGMIPWIDTIHIGAEIRVKSSPGKVYFTWKMKTIHEG